MSRLSFLDDEAYADERADHMPSRFSGGGCSDRMCGAADCSNCHPENDGKDLDAEDDEEGEE